MQTRYDVLGVPEDATTDAIKLAYRRLAKWIHPDNHPSPVDDGWENPWPHEIIRLINEARDTLVDPARRAEYDAKLRAHRERQKAASKPLAPPPAVPFFIPPSLMENMLNGVAGAVENGIGEAGKAVGESIAQWGKRQQ